MCDIFLNIPYSLLCWRKAKREDNKGAKRPARKETTVSCRAPPWLSLLRIFSTADSDGAKRCRATSVAREAEIKEQIHRRSSFPLFQPFLRSVNLSLPPKSLGGSLPQRQNSASTTKTKEKARWSTTTSADFVKSRLREVKDPPSRSLSPDRGPAQAPG